MKKITFSKLWQTSFTLLLFILVQMNTFAQVNFISTTNVDANANTLTLDLSVENFTDILSTQFTLAWDASVLTYASVNNLGLPSLDQDDFGNNPLHLNNGKLTFAWFDGNVTGVSLTDGAIVFSVVFDMQSMDDPAFAIIDCPTQIEVISLDDEEALFFNGVAAVGCNGAGNNGGDTISDWVVEFPADVTVDWPATTNLTGNPVIYFNDEELVGVSFTDEVFYNVVGFDAKIERTWKAVNWSEVELPFTNYIVEVPENQLVAPNDDLNGDGVSNERTFRDSWDGVDFPNTVGADWDGCIVYTQTIWINEGTAFPCQIDVNAPTPYCLTGITVLLDGTSTPPAIDVWAADFDAGSFDDCSDELLFSFSNNPGNESITYTEADLGINAVDIWVTDETGNQDFCSSFIHVIDELPSGGLSVSGHIVNAFNAPMEGVTVDCSFGTILFSTTTDASGYYEFTNLPAGLDYKITANKPSTDYYSEVTAFDVAKMRCIILGLETPERHHPLAGDLNNSFGLTTLDMVLLTRIILGMDMSSVNIPVWQFAADFGASNWSAADVSQEIVLENLLSSKINQNFTGVKAGNLVQEINPNPLYQPSFDLEEVVGVGMNQVQIDLTVESLENFTSTQFALTWDDSVLAFDDYELMANPPAGSSIWTEANMVDGNLRVIVMDQGLGGILDLEDGETLLRFTFNILQTGNTEVSFVDDAIFPKLITVNGCELAGGVFNFTNATIDLLSTSTNERISANWEAKLLPNIIPNGTTGILELLNEETATYDLQIFDTNGQSIWTNTIAGSGQIQHEIPAPNTPGIYFLQITNENGRGETLKLITF